MEARELLRHPATITGGVLSTAFVIAFTWTSVPVLNRYDALTHEALVPVAAAILIAAHLATIRSRRHRTTELFEGLTTSEATVTAGLLIAVVYISGLALLFVLAQLAYMKAIGGVTSPRLVVILIGPALVAFAGAFGVALGRWAPRMFAGPLGLAGLVALCTVALTDAEYHNREWLSLWVPNEILFEGSSEFTIQPYEWRFAYLIGLVLVAVGVAFARHAGKRTIAVGLILAAASGTAVAGAGTIRKPARSDQDTIVARLSAILEDPQCREHASVTYCPLPGYEPWIERWRKPTEGVLAAVPAAARPDDLRFLQAPSTGGMDYRGPVSKWLRRERRRGVLSLETDITPTSRWGRNGHEGRSELAIALLVAGRAIDAESPRRGRSCSLAEQGRAIVGLWLGAQATAGTETTLGAVADRNPYTVEMPSDPTYFLNPIPWELEEQMGVYAADAPFAFGVRDLAFAEQLLQKDEATVRSVIAENWEYLIDPTTTSDQAAVILALDPLPPLRDVLKEWGYGRRYGGPKCR